MWNFGFTLTEQFGFMTDAWMDVTRAWMKLREWVTEYWVARCQARAERQQLQLTQREQVEYLFMTQNGWKSHAAMNKADRVWLEARVRDIVRD